jgi:predicted nucleic acid-binding protein
MSLLVFDASAALSLLVASQATPKALDLAENFDEFDLIAPDIFRWEVTNVLLALARRSPAFDLEAGLNALSILPVELGEPLSADELDDVVAVAMSCELSLFDASYLRLAIQSDASLASRDRKLLDAADLNGIVCLDLGADNPET